MLQDLLAGSSEGETAQYIVSQMLRLLSSSSCHSRATLPAPRPFSFAPRFAVLTGDVSTYSAQLRVDAIAAGAALQACTQGSTFAPLLCLALFGALIVCSSAGLAPRSRFTFPVDARVGCWAGNAAGGFQSIW